MRLGGCASTTPRADRAPTSLASPTTLLGTVLTVRNLAHFVFRIGDSGAPGIWRLSASPLVRHHFLRYRHFWTWNGRKTRSVCQRARTCVGACSPAFNPRQGPSSGVQVLARESPDSIDSDPDSLKDGSLSFPSLSRLLSFLDWFFAGSATFDPP
ncbi:hypothetical protein T439DRAFT_192686 [Meredithblackwellia eburnea MCA 4105]